MPKAVRFENIEVLAAGGTDTILATSFTEKVILSTTGGIVMAGNYTLTHDGLWAEGSELDVLWTGSATLGASNITLFGYALTQAQATAGNLEGKAYAKSGSVVFTPNLTAGSAQVGTADITDEAVTLAKMADLARGSMIIGGVSNRPVALDIKAAGAIPVGDGTDAVARTVTGDITMNSAGVTAIGANVIVDNDISNSAAIQVLKLEAMSDNEVITGNTGAGNIATIVPMSADALIANTGAVTVQAGTITPEKASNNLRDEVVTVHVNFDDGGVFNWTTVVPYAYTIVSDSCILETAAVGNLDVTLDIGGVAVTGGDIAFAALDAANTQNAGTAITANNTGAAGSNLNLTVTSDNGAETAHGIVSIKLRKTS